MFKPPYRVPDQTKRRSSGGRLASIAALLKRVLPGGDSSPIEPDAPVPTIKRGLPGPLRDFLERTATTGAHLPVAVAVATSPLEPDGVLDGRAHFIDGTYANHAGRRTYKLFVPSGYCGRPVPLIVMLHGCTQSAADFAAGTRMNVRAEEHTCLVVYPEQALSANVSRCWNWFNESHQQRDLGEPSIIAGITHHIMQNYAVDTRRVYVAGLSAGAAEAAILGAVYPDLYAAIGVHSGLPYGAARNLPAALAAMRNGTSVFAGRPGRRGANGGGVVPAIVFHGDRDTTVHPANADALIAQGGSGAVRITVEQHRVPGGHAYSFTRHVDADDNAVLEQWVVHGAGHAWSGGSSAGSYTDPLGPDATSEMLRFFLDHVRPESAAVSAPR